MIAGLTSHLWQSTWFAAAVALLTLAFRGNRARVRYGLWLCASAKFFVPFSVLIGLGGHMIANRVVTPHVPITVERIAVSFAEPVTFAAAPAQAERVADWRPITLAGVWACGLAAIALVRLRGWRRVRAALRASRSVDIPAVVEIRSAPGLLEPGVVGLLRPVLLLPDGIMERLTASQLEAVLAHELCHVRRRDNLFAALHMFVEAMFWFHPLVWWIGARMVEERERACDEGVLSLGSEPRTYAEAILGVCKLYVESPLVCVSGVTGADLKKRIEAIMSNRIGLGLNLTKKLLLASAGAAALVGPVVMGVVIGASHASALRAQSPVATQTPAPVPAAAQTLRPPQTTAPNVTAQVVPQGGRGSTTATAPLDHRMLTLLFDCGAMTSDEQARARQAAIQYVQARMQPTDLLSVMMASEGKLKVVQDFTGDKALLASVLSQLGGQGDSSGASRLATLEQAARMLGAIPGKKALLYFSDGTPQPGPDDQAQLQRAIGAAVAANVAFYAIDARGVLAVPSDTWPQQPIEQARANVGSASTRAPLVTYTGTPAVASTLTQAFDGQRTTPVNAAIIAGLPGRHAEFQTYPAGERQVLTVPLVELSGRIDIVAEIRKAPGSGDTPVVANLRDFVTIREPRTSGMYEAKFALGAGSYTASLLVRENATGRQFAETISFEVK
jgi:VWFA-related protein